jgi:hypothetical protein
MMRCTLQHGFGCQRPTVVGGMKHPVIELLQVVGSETAYLEMADGGEDVPVDLPPVSIPGRLCQVDLLPWKPLVGEIGAECERPHLVVASIQLGRQSGGQLFGFLLAGAGGMPAPLLLTGDWVQSFVHDRIPTVTLAGYITSHKVSFLGFRPSKPGRRIGRSWSACGRTTQGWNGRLANVLVRSLEHSC